MREAQEITDTRHDTLKVSEARGAQSYYDMY